MMLLALAAALPGCRSADPPAPLPRVAAAIIFVPGFKGSALAHANGGGRVWLTASEAFWGKDTLAANGPALGIPAALDLKTDGLLRTIPVIPGLYDLDVYDSWMRQLRETFPGVRLLEFSYDWRADPMEAVRGLHRTVSALRAEGIAITILGHSFGGLIASYYLRYGAQEPEQARETWEGAQSVRKVVLAGVPFRGAINKFRDMQQGEIVGMNDTLLDATAHSSFASSYYLLPAPTEAGLVSDTLEPFPGLLYAAGNWEQYRWGLFRPYEALSLRDREARRAFLAGSLERAATFSRLLFAPLSRPPSPAPQVINVVGHGRSTPARAIWREDRRELIFNHDDQRLFEDGDGVVTLRSATLPPAYREALRPASLLTLHEHGEIWSDPQLRDALIPFLVEGEIISK